MLSYLCYKMLRLKTGHLLNTAMVAEYHQGSAKKASVSQWKAPAQAIISNTVCRRGNLSQDFCWTLP